MNSIENIIEAAAEANNRIYCDEQMKYIEQSLDSRVAIERGVPRHRHVRHLSVRSRKAERFAKKRAIRATTILARRYPGRYAATGVESRGK